MSPHESLLDEVVQLARLKGAEIIEWKYSPNGRTVIVFREKLPSYHLSVLSAADHLIHRYNLITRFRHLYCNPPIQFEDIRETLPKAEASNIQSEKRIINRCDDLLLPGDRLLGPLTRKKIIQSIHQENPVKRIDYNDFISYTGALVNHYRRMTVGGKTAKEKNRFIAIVKFIENFTFEEYRDLYL